MTGWMQSQMKAAQEAQAALVRIAAVVGAGADWPAITAEIEHRRSRLGMTVVQAYESVYEDVVTVRWRP